MDSNDDGFKPPYMSFQTFWNFISELGSKQLPPRIDRSLMITKSGSDQANLMMALTSFGLVDDQSNVLPKLQELTAANDDDRKSVLAHLVTRYYAEPMRVSANHGTSKDLNDAFTTSYPSIASSDTRRKCVTFFLHAAHTGGLPLSVHFPTTRSGSGAPGASKTRKASPRRKSPAADADGRDGGQPGDQGQSEDGDTYTVELTSGGSVSVVVRVNLFALTTDDRDFVIDLVDKLKGYKVPSAKKSTEEEGSE
ncbi:hypothetical protein [Mycolicibacterium sp.]|uniref:hypothetical protein n=1 Tax=Mycolicibacterium sp. TaxID=2320850 RepID=UPI0028AE595C|nr:hypothetical protein [Mycolicibacterium sp.]